MGLLTPTGGAAFGALGGRAAAGAFGFTTATTMSPFTRTVINRYKIWWMSKFIKMIFIPIFCDTSTVTFIEMRTHRL